MIKYALFSYIPRRYWRTASFDELDVSRMILGFKDGRNVYSRWAARQLANSLAPMDLTGITIVCIPASTHCANVRRWKLFSCELCSLTGADNGFDHIRVSGSRRRAHITGEYELATNIKHFVDIDSSYFRNRKVLVVDDIYTTGKSATAFIGALEAAGASVPLAMFLAKTLSYRRR